MQVVAWHHAVGDGVGHSAQMGVPQLVLDVAALSRQFLQGVAGGQGLFTKLTCIIISAC